MFYTPLPCWSIFQYYDLPILVVHIAKKQKNLKYIWRSAFYKCKENNLSFPKSFSAISWNCCLKDVLFLVSTVSTSLELVWCYRLCNQSTVIAQLPQPDPWFDSRWNMGKVGIWPFTSSSFPGKESAKREPDANWCQMFKYLLQFLKSHSFGVPLIYTVLMYGIFHKLHVLFFIMMSHWLSMFSYQLRCTSVSRFVSQKVRELCFSIPPLITVGWHCCPPLTPTQHLCQTLQIFLYTCPFVMLFQYRVYRSFRHRRHIQEIAGWCKAEQSAAITSYSSWSKNISNIVDFFLWNQLHV